MGRTSTCSFASFSLKLIKIGEGAALLMQFFITCLFEKKWRAGTLWGKSVKKKTVFKESPVNALLSAGRLHSLETGLHFTCEVTCGDAWNCQGSAELSTAPSNTDSLGLNKIKKKKYQTRFSIQERH